GQTTPSRNSRHRPPFSFFKESGHHRNLHSFPTRRSSDLCFAIQSRQAQGQKGNPRCLRRSDERHFADVQQRLKNLRDAFFKSGRDRKSTRLNSSHVAISYAVFCLKKKTTPKRAPTPAPST